MICLQLYTAMYTMRVVNGNSNENIVYYSVIYTLLLHKMTGARAVGTYSISID